MPRKTLLICDVCNREEETGCCGQQVLSHNWLSIHKQGPLAVGEKSEVLVCGSACGMVAMRDEELRERKRAAQA